MIHEFDPVIYPFRVWVAIKPKVEDVSEKFFYLDTAMNCTPVTADDFYKTRFDVATTYPMENKESGALGCFIAMWRPKDFVCGMIAHEASHVTDFLCEVLGVSGFTLESGESRAYFLGWVADCIDKVKRGKV